MTTLSRTWWAPAALGLSAALTLCAPAAAQLDAFHAQFWSQESFAFSTPEDSDNFGKSLATGDFDGDGYADLAIGSPNEDVLVGLGQNVVNAGTVIVLYGTVEGLSATDAQLFRQGGSGLAGTAEEGDFWGHALATGDFNGDGYDDLAVGAPLRDNGTQTDMGEVSVIYGSASGLTPSGSETWTDFYFVDHPDYYLGWALTAGDFNGDGYDELAVGMPGGLNQGGSGGCVSGAVLVFDGSASGLVEPPGPAHYWDPGQDLDLTVRCSEDFGSALAAGDLDGDGFDDLVVGSPGWTWLSSDHTFTEAGAVHVIYGSGSGLIATGDALAFGTWDNDHFGSAVAVGNVAWSFPVNRKEVIASAPGAEVGDVVDAGRVRVCPIFSDGVFDHDSFTWWDQDTAGVLDVAATDDNFGVALAVGNIDGDLADDLVIGTPFDNYIEPNDGVVQVLFGNAGGLSAEGDELWTQNSPGVPDFQESGDQFGRALALGDFNGDSRPDLAVGVPYDPLYGFSQGAVVVLHARGPGWIFADDFERGTKANWTSSVP